MHYVSWDRTDTGSPALLAEGGPEILATFTHDRATLDHGERTAEWELISTPDAGATATDGGTEVVTARGSLKRDKQLPVVVDGRGYLVVAESAKNFIVDDANGNKVAQFTADHNGVRRAILEFEGETDLPYTDIVGLAWVTRLVLESRKMVNTTAIIAFLVFLSMFVVIVWYFGPAT